MTPGHRQLAVAVHPPGEAQATRHELGMGDEELVERDRFSAFVERDQGRVAPRRSAPGRLTFDAATQDHQITDHLGPRGLGKGAGGQAHRADKIAQRGHLGSGRGSARIERVPGAQQRHQAPRAREVEALEDEVVVKTVVPSVVTRIVGGDLGKGDVADDQIEGAFGGGEVLEPKGVDGGAVAVEMARHRRARRVHLDTGDLRARRREPDEVPRTTARLQDHPARKAQRAHRAPDRLDDRRRGVVGVEDAPPGALEGRLVAEEALHPPARLRVAIVGLVEHLGKRTPPRPPRQDRPLVPVGSTGLALHARQHFERGDVGAEFGGGPGRRQVTLAAGSKR